MNELRDFFITYESGDWILDKKDGEYSLRQKVAKVEHPELIPSNPRSSMSYDGTEYARSHYQWSFWRDNHRSWER